MVSGSDEEREGEPGYFVLESEELWSEDFDELPESWFDYLRSGRRPRQTYARHIPRRLYVQPDGAADAAGGAGLRGWFQPSPLMLCLRCRVSYDLRERSDFKKLFSLSQTARSTATTVTVGATVIGLGLQVRARADTHDIASKVLSFTDNRQDASLQAGHLNDFVQVAQLRAGIVAALAERSTLKLDELGTAVFSALALAPDDFMREPVPGGPGFENSKRAMIDLLEYRALEDLGRAWRIAQPNLEQCGLVRIDYEGIETLARDDSLWRGLPAIEDANPALREDVLRAILDHLRGRLVIDADSLTEERTRRLVTNSSQWLAYPWALEPTDRLRGGRRALLPGVEPSRADQHRDVMRLGARSAIARYLRSARTWDTAANLTAEEGDQLTTGVIRALRGHLVVVEKTADQADYSVKVQAGALVWMRGDGRAAAPDRVRARSLHLRKEAFTRPANRYFVKLYEEGARKPFVDALYLLRVRLPDRAQYRPTADIFVQTDFYYERDGAPGVCVFIDGAGHDAPEQRRHDTEVRGRLEDLGYRVLPVRTDEDVADIVRQYGDVFGRVGL